LAQACAKGELEVYKDAARQLLDTVAVHAHKAKKGVPTVEQLHKTLWYLRQSCVCTAAKLSFYGKAFQLVRGAASPTTAASRELTEDDAADAGATIDVGALILGLQLATKGTLFCAGLQYLLKLLGVTAHTTAPRYTFAQFWPVAALAERLVDRKAEMEPYLLRIRAAKSLRPNYLMALELFHGNSKDGTPLLPMEALCDELRASKMPEQHVQQLLELGRGGVLVGEAIPFFEFVVMLPAIFGVRVKSKSQSKAP
jgi:hypothetical protein